MVFAVDAVVGLLNPLIELAVVALPLSAAVMVPAVKLPEASRATIVETVLALVALLVMV